MVTRSRHGGFGGRLRSGLLIFLFACWLLLPGGAQLAGFNSVDDIPKIEFRKPALRPAMPRDVAEWTTYPSRLEAYLNDHFGLRSQMGRMNSTLMALLGTSSSDDVLIGQDGWLFYSKSPFVDEYRGTSGMGVEEVDLWIASTRRLIRSLDERGMASVVAFVPNKWTVYPEHLPVWARGSRPQTHRYDVIAERLSRSSVLPFADVKPTLLNAKAEGPLRLFMKTDTHWTTRAAYLGYRDIMAELVQQLPQIRGLDEEDIITIPVDPFNGGDLYRFLNSTPMFSEPGFVRFIPNPQLHRVLETRILEDGKWIATTPADGLQRVWKTAFRSDARNRIRALVYGDSFTIPMQAFLIHTFSEVVFVRHEQLGLDASFIDCFDPQVVLFILNEKALRIPPRLVPTSPGLERLQWESGPHEHQEAPR